MEITQKAEIPEIVGGEAATLTQKGNPYIFRTSFGQQFSMPKIANYIADGLKAKTVALVWVNSDFGKPGRDNFLKEMAKHNIKVVADVSTELGQTDFSADVIKVKEAKADAIFLYINEEECARFLKEAKKQGIKTQIVGETTVLSQKVIDLAGGAAEGVQGHVALSVDVPVPAVTAFARKVQEEVQLRLRSQRHQGLYRRLLRQIRHREDGQVRQQGASSRSLTASPSRRKRSPAS